MKDNRKLAKYLVKQMEGCTVKGLGKPDMLYLEKPLESTLSFWIQQYQTRKCVGHSEWSERFQRNIWVSDHKEEDE